MAIDLATLVARFPDFSEVESESPGLIDAKLTEAQQFLDEAAFADVDLYETAVFYYAASLLLDSMYGSPMTVSPKQGQQFTNRYYAIFKKRILPLIHRRGHISGGGLT